MSPQAEGSTTNISWCDHTFNPWWGCEHAPADDPTLTEMVDSPGPFAISEECRNCYAESFDHRLGGMHWGPSAEPRWASESYWRKLEQWNRRAEREGKRHRVFVSSMADWAQRHAVATVNEQMDRIRARLWTFIRTCTWLDFLVLTKRAERLDELLPWQRGSVDYPSGEPWPNVWVGVTCATRRSMWRVPYLRATRAAVRFISAEPLLPAAVPGDRITPYDWDEALGEPRAVNAPRGAIHWLIVGDESGSERRQVDTADVEVARDAAARNGIAFHLKQLHNSKGQKVHLPVFHGKVHGAFPVPR